MADPTAAARRRWRPGFTPGAFALFVDAVLCVSAWAALAHDVILVPPLFIFFTLDHPLFLALLTLVICAVDFALERTEARAVILGVAVVFLVLAAVHVRNDPSTADEHGYDRSE